MRKLLLGCILVIAAAVTHAAPVIGEAGGRHLLERTGFGAPPAQVAEFAKLTREQAVDKLLANPRQQSALPPPALAYERPARLKNLGEDEKKEVQRELFRQGTEMRAWWVGEMLRAPTPGDALSERMTLFWHNHFVSSQQKVKSGALMLRQNELLRRHALGNFATLLHAVSKDPAMVIYLDSATNRKASPNENFAREVMELFTLGEGNYTEQDVKEAARAFTGWSFEPETGEYRWRPAMHDFASKTILGRTGEFDGDGVLDILLTQPSTPGFIVEKLWREFISPQPDKAEVRRIAANFRGAGYEIRAALKPLLLSNSFWAPENRGTLTKSPVDLVIGSLRTLEVNVPDALPLVFSLRQLGQDLFAPPNVKGWVGGEAWLNSTTLLARKQYLERLTQLESKQMGGRNMLREMAGKGIAKAGDDGRARIMQAMLDIRFDSDAWLRRYSDAKAVQAGLLAVPPVQAQVAESNGLPLLRALLLDPAFQVK